MQSSLKLSLLLLFIFTNSFLLAQKADTTTKKTAKPNIVLINMDDMGLGDVDLYGATEYTTPNIDKLAAEGMRFTNFYSTSNVCTPSRASLMTGSYPQRVGIPFVLWPHAKTGLSQKEETIATILKKAGYSTGMIGKWHLGDSKQFLPLQHGFDYYFGLPYSNDMWPNDYKGEPLDKDDPAYDPPLPLIEGNKSIRYIKDMDDQNHLTTWYTEKAVNYIEKHKSEPFFLYLAHNMVHVPLGVSDKFRGKSKQGIFGDVMMEIDWSVGQIMKTLKENDLKENTLVIFTADNGPWILFGKHGGSTAGLRGQKTTTWEGGHREPAIMSWPDVIPKGTISNKLASNIDILPTLSKITGAPLPEKKIDGVNIFPLLKGATDVNPRQNLYYYENKDLEAVRQGKWKLVFPHSYGVVKKQGKNGRGGQIRRDSTGMALYNTRNDAGERYDVKQEHPEVVQQLKELAEKARKELGDALENRKGNERRDPGYNKEAKGDKQGH